MQVCTKRCISFDEDKHGFRYPIVNEEICVDCGLCEKVCPALHPFNETDPVKIFAAKNTDSYIRSQSSSGGVFTLLSEYVIKKSGVVFGACFDEEWEVVHSYTETIEGLSRFRGSKYVQSRIGDCYKQAKNFLCSGRLVLFSGTPCQIAGLKRFLGREYENLINVEVICHGVPSPLVWRKYLDNVATCNFESHGSAGSSFKDCISTIMFRDKSKGWKNYNFSLYGNVNGAENVAILSESHRDNEYMQVFLKDFSLRPSCSKCPAKGGKSGSDIGLADYWGIESVVPEYDDDKGTSLVLAYTDLGLKLVESVVADRVESSFDACIRYNPCIKNSIKFPRLYNRFWFSILTEDYTNSIAKFAKLRPDIIDRIRRLVIKIINKIIS